jgi:hypothetical protein
MSPTVDFPAQAMSGERPVTVREQAHRDATRLELPRVAERLQEMLGQQIVAYATGIKDPRAIGKIARGETKRPAPATEARLRRLYEITQILLTRETAETVRAWMIGSHPLLEHRAPVEMLHEDDYQPVQRTAEVESSRPASLESGGFISVVEAAEAFVGTY